MKETKTLKNVGAAAWTVSPQASLFSDVKINKARCPITWICGCVIADLNALSRSACSNVYLRCSKKITTNKKIYALFSYESMINFCV